MALSIISNQVLLLYFVYLFYRDYQISYDLLCKGDASLDPEYCYTSPSDLLLYVLFGIAVITIIYPIVILVKVKTIRLSIGIIKLATRPFYTLKQIFFYPLMQLLIGTILLGFLFMVILYTMSTGIIKLITSTNLPGGRAKIIEYTETEKYYMIYNVIMSVWWISFLIAFSEFVLSAAVSVWYFTRERSSLYFPLWRGFKLIVRYHMGSVVRGSLLTTLFQVPSFLLENFKSLSALCRYSKPGCTDCMLRSCSCMKCHQKWLRYFTKYSYIFLALFGEGYYEAARKSYYLINRNRERIFVPAKAGDFGMLIIKTTIMLSGTAIAYTLVLLSEFTPSGQPTSDLVAPTFICLISLLISAYIAQIFGGSMQACINTIIICGACDEEMFTREQRYMYKELQDYLDQIYEEMTEQQKENKEMVKMKASKNAYRKGKVVDDTEGTSVMKPLFNQNNEISAPVKAMNIQDLENDDDNVFALAKPNIVMNTTTKPGNNFLTADYNSKDPFQASFRKNLDSNQSSRNFQFSALKKTGDNSKINENPMLISEHPSFINANPNDRTKEKDVGNMFASPNASFANRSRNNISRGIPENPGLGPNASFFSQKGSFADSQNRNLLDMNSSDRKEPGLNPINEESPIHVYNENSLEVEGGDGIRPSFQR